VSVTQQQVLDALAKVASPRGVALTNANVLSAITVADGKVFFSINVDAAEARGWESVRAEAEALSAGKHRISLEISGDHDLLGAEREIASAFTNLATNAVRYTPAGGEVRLRWRSGSEGGEFSVEDSGIGIDPEHLPRLTERFYRVDRGRSRETGGTGLGLAIVKHVLTRHQATLEITSEPGKAAAGFGDVRHSDGIRVGADDKESLLVGAESQAADAGSMRNGHRILPGAFGLEPGDQAL